jgi:hypothetical protein
MAQCRALIMTIVMAMGIVLLGDGVFERVSALVQCVPPTAAPTNQKWPGGAPITVNISGFPGNLEACVQTAFNNWNSANSKANPNGNGSGVTLDTEANAAPLPTGQTGGTNVYQVTWGQTKDVNGNPTTVFGSTQWWLTSTNMKNASTQINPNITNCAAVTETMAHEIGHTMGLNECDDCTPQQSVMIPGPCAGNPCIPIWNDTTYGLPGPTSCDINTVSAVYYPKVTAPGCNPDCPIPPPKGCNPCGGSPIILDLNGEGFHLTNAQNGVSFDISGTGSPVQIGWVARGADNGFLALPGPDGLVHSRKQLFGNFTPQPASDAPNGFAALAVYDTLDNGGNGDGLIDARDAVFASLRIWIDANHDGITQPTELFTLAALRVKSISLDYRDASRKDEYGNRFRYRARVLGDESSDLGRTAYDVFFVGELPATTCIQKIKRDRLAD